MRVIGLIVATLSCGIALACQAQKIERAAVETFTAPSMEELIAAVEAARKPLREIDVTYSYETVNRDGEVASRDVHHLRWLDGRMLIDRWYGPQNEPRHVTSGFDGEYCWAMRAGLDRATIVRPAHLGGNPARLPQFTTIGTGFTDFLHWYPCYIARFNEPLTMELPALLRSGLFEVRDKPERIGDSLCIVLDSICADGVCLTSSSIWLDPARGYLPILQRTYQGPTMMQEVRIDEATEAAPGLWLPLAGSRTEVTTGRTHRMAVKSLAVNAGAMSEADFDRTAHIPEGTHMFDIDSGEQWVLSAKD